MSDQAQQHEGQDDGSNANPPQSQQVQGYAALTQNAPFGDKLYYGAKVPRPSTQEPFTHQHEEIERAKESLPVDTRQEAATASTMFYPPECKSQNFSMSTVFLLCQIGMEKLHVPSCISI